MGEPSDAGLNDDGQVSSGARSAPLLHGSPTASSTGPHESIPERHGATLLNSFGLRLVMRKVPAAETPCVSSQGALFHLTTMTCALGTTSARDAATWERDRKPPCPSLSSFYIDPHGTVDGTGAGFSGSGPRAYRKLISEESAFCDVDEITTHTSYRAVWSARQHTPSSWSWLTRLRSPILGSDLWMKGSRAVTHPFSAVCHERAVIPKNLDIACDGMAQSLLNFQNAMYVGRSRWSFRSVSLPIMGIPS